MFAKEITFFAPPLFAAAEIQSGRAGCFEREHDSCPVVAVSHHMATEIVFVQTVRDYHDDTAARTVQSIADDVVEAAVYEFNSSDVFSILDFEWVVDNDVVGAVASELAADWRCIDAAACRRREVGHPGVIAQFWF